MMEPRVQQNYTEAQFARIEGDPTLPQIVSLKLNGTGVQEKANGYVFFKQPMMVQPRKSNGSFDDALVQPLPRLRESHVVRNQHRRAALVLALVAGLLGACVDRPRASGLDADGLPLGPVTYKDISAHPETQLYYPDATVISIRGSDERTVMIKSRSAAFGGAILASQATAEQIYAWYREYLTAHHWSSCDALMALNQVSLQAYCRGHREHFVVAVDNPRLLQETLGQTLPPDAKTIFETTYLISPAPSGAPTVTPAPSVTASQ
jgi:hypothetical protein